MRSTALNPRTPLRISLTLLAALLLFASRPAAAQEVETSSYWLDPLFPTGDYPSLARGPSGTVYLGYAYLSPSAPAEFRIAYRDAGACTWQSTTLDPNGAGFRSAMATDAQGRHVVYLSGPYGSRELQYRRIVKSYGSLSVESSADLGPADGAPVSIAVDAGGHAHVSYSSGSILRYATDATGQWEGASYAEGGYPEGKYGNAIAMDSQGNAHIAYTVGELGSLNLAYVQWTGTSWSPDPIPMSSGGRGCAIAIGADDLPRISFEGRTGAAYDELRYAERTPSQWVVTPIGTVAAAYSTALVLGAGDEPRIATWVLDDQTAALFYVYRQDGIWHVVAPGAAPPTSGGADPISMAQNLSGYGLFAISDQTGTLRVFEETPGQGDGTPPAAVGDLNVQVGKTTAAVYWTATGDDGTSGTASNYDLRYSSLPISDGNFYQATRIATDCPAPAGYSDCATATGLYKCSPYYFALRVRDNAGNWSPLSNVAYGVTHCSGWETFCNAGFRARGVTPEGIQGGLDLRLASANPARSWATVNFAIPAGAVGEHVELAILDVAGRTVRTLVSGAAEPGRHEESWDLRGDDGQRAAPGIYFASLSLQDRRLTRVIVVTR